jgi:hypothetical protein
MLLTDLIDTYCAAWSDESAEQRQALLAQVWADGATYTDPTVDLAGVEALLAHIAAIRSRYPGVSIVRTSEVDCHHGIARFGWRFVLADGSSFPEGLDIAFLDSSQTRITRIIGFFGPLAKSGAP